MLTVICVYWRREHPDKQYSASRHYSAIWVHRLKNMVKESLSIPHRFICLSNVEVNGIETISLKHNWIAQWSKIELFRSDLPGDRFLYIDLDSLPLYHLEDLVSMDGSFIAISPKIANIAKEMKKRGRTFYLASGVMVWDKGYANIIYDTFDELMIKKFVGDQDWIGQVLADNKIKFDLFPREWIKLLREIPHNFAKLPFGCKLICCSPNGWRQDIVVEYKGKQYQWVEKIWKEGVGAI